MYWIQWPVDQPIRPSLLPDVRRQSVPGRFQRKQASARCFVALCITIIQEYDHQLIVHD
jgi:hypothetical protein